MFTGVISGVFLWKLITIFFVLLVFTVAFGGENSWCYVCRGWKGRESAPYPEEPPYCIIPHLRHRLIMAKNVIKSLCPVLGSTCLLSLSTFSMTRYFLQTSLVLFCSSCCSSFLLYVFCDAVCQAADVFPMWTAECFPVCGSEAVPYPFTGLLRPNLHWLFLWQIFIHHRYI